MNGTAPVLRYRGFFIKAFRNGLICKELAHKEYHTGMPGTEAVTRTDNVKRK